MTGHLSRGSRPHSLDLDRDLDPASSSYPAVEAGRAGPLVVSPSNPRYFTVAGTDPAEEKAIYLTGSHIWNNFHDGMGQGAQCADTPEPFDFQAYLDFLKDHGHNFIRLWRWEHVTSQAAGGAFHLCMTPQPWARVGPGAARDGKPKFDLSTFDEGYFDRLRERVAAAAAEGIYVAVMLFDGFCMHLTPPPDNIEGHPFHTGNNISDISITSIVDYQVLPLDPRVQACQEAYVRKVVDTVQDLPNVLYEVANESSGDAASSVRFPDGSSIPTAIGDSTQWQYWIISVVKQYEQQMGYCPHPVGMTMQYPVPDQSKVNEPLFGGPADWISPGFDDRPLPGAGRWLSDPPISDGTKVVISDTDHYAAGKGDALWAWKSFLRGHHPILMDFGLIEGMDPPDPSAGPFPYAAFEPCRLAMGDTRRIAEHVDLLRMQPSPELSSTGYALADPGREYLVLDPAQAAHRFTVTAEPGTYAVQWHSVLSRETEASADLTVEGQAAIGLDPPFDGPVVVHLKGTASEVGPG